MKIFIRGVVAALAISFAAGSHVEAQTDHTGTAMSQTVYTGISCLDAFHATLFAFNACSGAWNGNNHGAGNTNPSNPSPGASITEAYIADVFGITASGMDYPGGSITGEFVLAVKGARAFSLFYFSDHDGATLDLAQAMRGVSRNSSGVPHGVSHATLYGGSVSVPEPTTIFLLGTSLLALTGLAWRRSDEVLA